MIAAEPAPLGNYAEHQDLSYVLRPDAKGEMHRMKIETGTDLGLRQRDVRRHMERVMGELPNPHARVPLDVRIQESVETEKYTRMKIDYAVEPGSRVPAYLLIPHGLKQAAPAMLCLHPTNFQTGKAQLLGMGGNTSRFYAHELAELGFICLAPDYPGFAEYKYDFKTEGSHYVAGTMKAIWDNVRAIDVLESLPITAHDKIGCIGHSLGGHNTLFTSCFDRRIRCAVTSCGFNAFEDYYGGKLKGWTSDRYMPRIESLFHSDPKQMPFDFPEVLAVMAPRPLLVNAPLRDANFEVVGVRKCEASVRPLYEKFGKSSDLVFRYPDAEHDFPDEVRSEAYQWLSDQLR
ncbi:MAG: alpha/beta hydrolase family protein [Pirellulales bacterium]